MKTSESQIRTKMLRDERLSSLRQQKVRQHLLVSSQRQLAQIEVAKAEFRALVDAWVTKYPPDDEERDFLGDFLADYFHERETASRAAMERAS